ncbi:hypothetical protein HAX54_028889 [Datura stramonium]|uniref:Uncharacterized protein n=1 Tax=Datura stramonium TaxID=4076 RepID=A0ABS8V7S7_DATST|nr:hypothetical protein [Datura stramonium]
MICRTILRSAKWKPHHREKDRCTKARISILRSNLTVVQDQVRELFKLICEPHSDYADCISKMRVNDGHRVGDGPSWVVSKFDGEDDCLLD